MTKRNLLKNCYSNTGTKWGQDVIFSRRTTKTCFDTSKLFENAILAISPPFFSDIYGGRDMKYNLQSNSQFVIPNVRSVFHQSFTKYLRLTLLFM